MHGIASLKPLPEPDDAIARALQGAGGGARVAACRWQAPDAPFRVARPMAATAVEDLAAKPRLVGVKRRIPALCQR